MSRKQRFAALFLAALFIAAMSVSFFVIAHEAGHLCTGSGCAVCARLAYYRNNIKALCELFFSYYAVSLTVSFALSAPTGQRSGSASPVRLKVRLLN